MHRLPLLILGLYVGLALVAVEWVPPVPQPAAYHAFADGRSWLGVPNFANVASNTALLFAGAWGLLIARRRCGAFRSAPERALYTLFFSAVLATAFGSTWYHLAPDSGRLFWDRLPLSFAFTALPALLVAERTVLTRVGLAALAAWLLVGPASVVYWTIGESAGQGDLRPYLLLHGFVLVLPPLLMCLPTPYTQGRTYPLAYLLYLVAMAGELLDHAVYRMLDGAVSGHTLKHLLMAIAVALLAHMLAVRRVRADQRRETERRNARAH